MKIGLVDSGLGLLIFIKNILKLNKNNDYYLFIDDKYFPYGNKNEELLLSRLKSIIAYFSKVYIDELLICCNTLSYIYLKYKLKAPFKIKTILELNLNKNKKLLTTNFLSNKIGSLSGNNLPQLIENKDIRQIINLIKRLDENNFILSCTHFPLIKSMFTSFNKIVYSYEEDMIVNLDDSKEKLKFIIEEKDLYLFKTYFPKLRIRFINDKYIIDRRE